MGINMASILKKLDAYMDTPAAKARTQSIVDAVMLGVKQSNNNNVHSVEEAGAKFAGLLLDTIASSGLDGNVVDALYHVDIGGAVKLGDGTYMISVYLAPQIRESMSTKKSYDAVDLVMLYNDGVDHVMRQIFETDESGVLRVSRTVIPGTHFIEQTVADFMGNYATEYNVIEIEINRD